MTKSEVYNLGIKMCLLRIKELEEELKESKNKTNTYKLLLNQFNLEECCEMCKHRDISRFSDACYECICGKKRFEAKYPDEIKEFFR